MTLKLPDATEMVKDGRLAPVAIQFLGELVKAVNQLNVDVSAEGGGIFEADSVSFINGLNATTLSPNDIELKVNSYFDPNGANNLTWEIVKPDIIGGTGWTTPNIYHFREATIETLEEIYDQQRAILERIMEIETALTNAGIIEVS